MAAPTGIEAEIYASPIKLSDTRVKVRLDKALATTNFVDEFAGSSLDPTLWSAITPTGSEVSVDGGNLHLQAYDTNGYPVVWSTPGKTFPLDPTIGWTLEWTLAFPVITGFGVFFRVIDLANENAIVAIKCNQADGLTVEMPDGTRRESLGLDTNSYNYTLVYTPATNIAAGSYELTRGGVSKGTMAATDRQAWAIVIGNGSIQTNVGNWTHMDIARIDVNLDSVETQDWPEWTDREEDSDNHWWGRIPWVSNISMGFHERNQVDQCILTIPQAGYIAGVGYRDSWFSNWQWANREVLIESRQGDGKRWTSWKTVFTGLCDEPRVQRGDSGPVLEVTVRDKQRRRLQMAHLVRGYSDAGGPIDGVVMGKSWTDIINDECDVVGLAATDYNVLSSSIKPRSWQVMGESALDNISQLAGDGVAAVYVNRTQANFGRIEVQDYDFGSDTPDFYVSSDADAVTVDWAESVFGMTAQVVVTVQHSEFGEFSDSYPRAPIPPTGAVIRINAAVAQWASDINSSRLLPYLAWRRANRELNAVSVRLMGQDWYEIGLEARVLDQRVLDVADEYYVVIGADYTWWPNQGWLVTLSLANQHPERAIMRAALDSTIRINYQGAPIAEGELVLAGIALTRTQRRLAGTLTMAGAITTQLVQGVTATATLTMAGAITTQLVQGVTATATLTMAGAITVQVRYGAAGALAMAGAIAVV